MYSPTAMDHFLNPRNNGVIRDGDGAVGRGEALNSDCGDTALITVRVVDGVISDARFVSEGCAGAIACCSAATEWLIGRSLDDARSVGAEDINEAVGGMPEAKQGCVQMATDAARQAAESAG